MELRTIPEPSGIRRARTLPASWYATPEHHDLEMTRVWRREWVCVGDVDELPAPGSWKAHVVGGVPVLVVHGRDQVLRAFLNVCRHRAAPLCDDVGAGALISCPYHAWLYRLDGTLARAHGIGDPDGFVEADHALRPVAITMWRRFVFVALDPRATPLDTEPLGSSIDAFGLEGFELAVRESHERFFNWKVLLENYSENYHTPFVHPQIDTSPTHDYPMVAAGRVLVAWDRPLRPVDETGRILAELLPGEPGWDRIAGTATNAPYDVGIYLTVWPNLMVNVFPSAALAMWVEPITPNRTRVERRLYVRPDVPEVERDAIIAAHRRVHDQDVWICEAVQRSHDAGVDADGILATVEERGVFFVHEHVRRGINASE